MFNLKALAILMLSAHLTLASTDVHFAEPTIWDIMFPEPVIIAANKTNRNNVPETLRADDCSAHSSDAGLGRLLREATSLQPMAQIQQIIVDSFFHESQVFDLVRLKRRGAFIKNINNIQQSSEYGLLREYACQQLNLDATMMWDFVESFISITKAKKRPNFSGYNGRPGIYGLMQDIRAVVPQQQSQALYQQLLVQDPLLSIAVERLKSEEFRQLLRNVHLHPDSLELRKKLVNAGVPLLELQQLINVALGWAENEFGDIGADLNV